MSHQDVEVAADWMAEFIPQSICSSLAFRKDARWSARQFVTVIWLWSLAQQSTLTERFEWARDHALRLFPEADRDGASFQAFMKMMRRWSDVLIVLLLDAIHNTMHKQLLNFRGEHGFALFGVDGSRIALPRTMANERRLTKGLHPKCRLRGRRRNRARKQAEIPSLWVTLLWHLESGLPWEWRLGSAHASEREHLLSLQTSLPTNSLLVADAGYGGYEYWSALLKQGVHFVIRVGSGVHLLKDLGNWQVQADRIWLWPANAAQKNLPPLKLRLVEIHTQHESVWLVTSVLSHGRLSDTQLRKIYRQRWGLEVFYRDFKQTLGKRKLLSRTPEHARLELHWSLLSLALLLLRTRLEQQHLPTSTKTSVSNILRVVRRALSGCYQTSQTLLTAVRNAIVDNYERKCKSRRAYPQRKTYHPPGKPQITTPSPRLNLLAKSLTPLTLTSYG